MLCRNTVLQHLNGIVPRAHDMFMRPPTSPLPWLQHQDARPAPDTPAKFASVFNLAPIEHQQPPSLPPPLVSPDVRRHGEVAALPVSNDPPSSSLTPFTLKPDPFQSLGSSLSWNDPQTSVFSTPSPWNTSHPSNSGSSPPTYSFSTPSVVVSAFPSGSTSSAPPVSSKPSSFATLFAGGGGNSGVDNRHTSQIPTSNYNGPSGQWSTSSTTATSAKPVPIQSSFVPTFTSIWPPPPNTSLSSASSWPPSFPIAHGQERARAW
jgi:hypothetical protein